MVKLPEPPGFRWGVLGPGRIAEEFARALVAVDEACLYAVASRDKIRAETFASDHGAVAAYGNYDALIADPAVDGIYIATPHRFHYQQARECILGGKPVLCEKPLTVNSLEARELITLAQEKGVFLMEAMRTRYLPIYREVRRALDAGTIGNIEKVTSSFGFEFPRDKADRLLNHELAGGVLLDMGVYNLSMSQWIFAQQPESFSIAGTLGETGVDEHDETTLVYRDGYTSTFSNSLTTRLNNDLTIIGSSGRISIHPMFWNATAATLVTSDGPGNLDETLTVTREFRATGLEYMIEEAVRAIREGLTESPGMPLGDTLDTMILMDQLRSAMGLTYTFE